MKNVVLFAALCVATTAAAQTKTGGISTKMLNEIQSENSLKATDRALVNAIAGNAIDDLAKNHQNAKTRSHLVAAGCSVA